MLIVIVFLFLFFVFGRTMWPEGVDLSSLMRDQTLASCSGSRKS